MIVCIKTDKALQTTIVYMVAIVLLFEATLFCALWNLKGDLDHNTVWFRSSLVNCLDAQHRYAEADLLLEEEASIRRLKEPRGSRTAFRLCSMAGRYLTYRKFDKSIKLFEEVLTFECVRKNEELFESIRGNLESAKSGSREHKTL